MAAKAPASKPADRLVTKQTQQDVPASAEKLAARASLGDAVVSDQSWLDQSQQVWDEQRQKEIDQARAEQAGDRVLQLLEGEQAAIGESLAEQPMLLAQARTEGNDRKAATVNSDDGISLGTLLGVGGALALLAGASGSGGGQAPAPAPAPAPHELLVYSNEDPEDEGHRVESGEVDTNTDEGPYTTVRVKAFDTGDSASLDDGDGDSLYVQFVEREDLAFEVIADGEDSSAYADVSTDSAFKGEILVSAANLSADADLSIWAYSSGDVAHSVELTVEAVSEDADAYAYVDLYGDANIAASLDAAITASAVGADASSTIYVGTYGSGEVSVSGNLDVTASSQDSSAYVYAEVWNYSDNSTDATEYTGNLSIDASGTSAFASAEFYVYGSGDAALSGDITVTGSGESSDAGAYVGVESYSADALLDGDVSVHASSRDAGSNATIYVSADDSASMLGDITLTSSGESSDAVVFAQVQSYNYSADALFSGDVSVDASATYAYAYADLSVYGSGDATLLGDMTVTNTGESAESAVYADISSNSEDAFLNGNISVSATGEDASSDATVFVSAGEDAFVSGDITVKTLRGESYAGASASVDVSGYYAEYSGDVLASTDGLSSDVTVGLSLDAVYADLQGNVTAVAGAPRDSSVLANIGMCADDVYIWGSDSYTEDSNDADGTTGYSYQDTAAEWTVSAAGQNNSADLSADIWADDYLSAELNVTAEATRTGAEVSASINLSTDSWYGTVVLQGNESWTETTTETSTETVSGGGTDYLSEVVHSVEASQFTSAVIANGASSDLHLDMGGEDIDAQVNFLTSAVGRAAHAVTDVHMSGEDQVTLGGGWASSETESQVAQWVNDSSSSETWTSGEDSTRTAADWVVSASGDQASASFDLWVNGEGYLDVDLSANVQAQASNGASADASITLYSDYNGLDTVSVSGDSTWSTQIESTYFSAETDNTVGEDFSVALSGSAAAVDWASVASNDASATIEVSIDAEYDVHMLANLSATAGAGSNAGTIIEIDSADGSVDLGGARSTSIEWFISSAESDLYTDYASGEDMTATYEAAQWAAVADGEGGTAELEVDIDIDSYQNVSVQADMTSAASANGSSSDINLFIDGGDEVYIGGGMRYSSSEMYAAPSDDVTSALWTQASTEYAADWQVEASGTGACADIEVDVSGDYIELRANQDITASGTGSYAATYVNLSADSALHVGGDQTFYASGDDIYNVNAGGMWSVDTTNSLWSVAATGANSVAELEFNAWGEDGVSLDTDLSVSASGAGSLASAEIHASADEWWGYGDTYMGGEDGASIAVTASGANSTAYVDVELTGEDVAFWGNVTVTANAASGLDADAVMVMNLDADEYGASFYGNIEVSALGADNDANMLMNVSGWNSYMSGEVTVKAVEGVASMSLNVDGVFDSFLSLDADEGGKVIMDLVADHIGSGDIFVYTDNDGEVTLKLDADSYDSWEDIDVYGDAGGVFNLVLQDGINGLDIDLSDDAQGFGGQFNLTFETPSEFSDTVGGTEDADNEVGLFMEVEGFNATGTLLDTIDFQGVAFDGGYATGSPVSGYSEFLDDAASALDGTTDYFFATDGTNGWLAVDGDGEDISYVIELVGVTNLDWDAVLSTQNSFV